MILKKKKRNNKLTKHESNLTIEECKKSVFKMKLDKTPGINGLPIEFYRSFWSNVQHFVVDVFNHCY